MTGRKYARNEKKRGGADPHFPAPMPGAGDVTSLPIMTVSLCKYHPDTGIGEAFITPAILAGPACVLVDVTSAGKKERLPHHPTVKGIE